MNWVAGQTNRYTCSQCYKFLGQSLQLPLCCLFYTHRRKDIREQVFSVYGYFYLNLYSAGAMSRAEVISLCLTKHKVGAGECFSSSRCVTSDLAPHHLGHAILGQGMETAGFNLTAKWPVAIPCTKEGGETDGGAVCPRPHRRSAGEARMEQTSLCPTTMIHLLSSLPGRVLLRNSIFKV